MKSAADFADIRLDGYHNINEIAHISDRLHMCETLFGDVEAPLLVVAQDGAPFEKISALVETEGPDGYRHGPDVATNKNLVYSLTSYLREHTGTEHPPARSSRIFYANAIWLMKGGERMASPLTKARAAYSVCQPVVEATIAGLPNLRLVLALGAHAYSSLVSVSPDLRSSWREAVGARLLQPATIFGKKVLVATTPHPSPLSGGKDKASLKANFEGILIAGGLLPS